MMRLSEARVLIDAGFAQGAYYLAGYAAECGLKACIAKRVRRYDFPDRRRTNDAHTHDVIALARIAGLADDLDAASDASATFAANWWLVTDWNEESRYDETISAQEARELYQAMANRRDGVMRWIRRHW